MEHLLAKQAALSIVMATFVTHDGTTNKQIRSFPITSMLKPRYFDNLDGGKLHNRDVLPHMLSFRVLRTKLASKLQPDFNPVKTVIWDAVQDLRITNDEDLQGTVLQQLEAKRLDAVYLQLREAKTKKRKRDGDGQAESKTKKRRNYVSLNKDNVEPRTIQHEIDTIKAKKAKLLSKDTPAQGKTKKSKKLKKEKKAQANVESQPMPPVSVLGMFGSIVRIVLWRLGREEIADRYRRSRDSVKARIRQASQLI
jgi:hypothetical protein